jgi:thiol-disulfide isomerase/thioredoxin
MPVWFTAVAISLFAFAMPAKAVEIGAPAPAFTLKEINSDRSLALASLGGKVVLLDFWASWCVPCRESLPLYDQLRREFAREDFEVLAVNVDEVESDAQQFLRQHTLSYPILRDTDGEVAKAYALPGMPSSYLIDRNGVVRARKIGFTSKDYESLRATIRQLIGTPDAH